MHLCLAQMCCGGSWNRRCQRGETPYLLTDELILWNKFRVWLPMTNMMVSKNEEAELVSLKLSNSKCWLLFHFSSVAQSYLILCDPMDYSMPGFPVHHQLPELIDPFNNQHFPNKKTLPCILCWWINVFFKFMHLEVLIGSELYIVHHINSTDWTMLKICFSQWFVTLNRKHYKN